MRVTRSPVETLDSEGQKILDKICEVSSSYEQGAACTTGSLPHDSRMVSNADLQNLAPKVWAMVERLHQSKQQLVQLWHNKRSKLEQCVQLNMFDRDTEKVAYPFFFFIYTCLFS